MPPLATQFITRGVRRLPFGLAAWVLAVSMLLVAGAFPLRADEFRTPAISAVHVEWRAVLDQLRSEISTQPPAGPPAPTLT